MIRIRPYKITEANDILSWCQDEKAFYQWTAGVLGDYPITKNDFGFVESLMPFTAFDESEIVGFFTLRNPKYYPKEVVDFFCKHHNKEHILEGIAFGNMGVLIYNDVIVGTGCFDGNHITGVYVLPFYQNQGCGSHIMNCLEKEIAKKYDTAILDASLPAACLYEHRGYKTVGHGIYKLENDVKLVYEIMEKKLKAD